MRSPCCFIARSLGTVTRARCLRSSVMVLLGSSSRGRVHSRSTPFETAAIYHAPTGMSTRRRANRMTSPRRCRGKVGRMERASITVEGEAFEVLSCGPREGPLAICLHGFPDAPGTWAPVMRRLADVGVRCAAPYLRGYAPSTLRGPFDADRLARDAVGLASAL